MKKEKCSCLSLGVGTLLGWQKVGSSNISSISIEGMNVPKKLIGKKIKLIIEVVNSKENK